MTMTHRGTSTRNARTAMKTPHSDIALCIIVGTRPNLVKINRLCHYGYVIYTNQHYSSSLKDAVTNDLEIKIDEIVLMDSLESRLKILRPQAVMVVGDVTSTLMGARAARACDLPLIHLESGLRCNEDIPEEYIRREVDQISDLLLCSHEVGLRNLAKEALTGVLVGNTMLDTLSDHITTIAKLKVCERFGMMPGEYIVTTFHRPHNVDSHLQEIMMGIKKIIATAPSLGGGNIIWPKHPRITTDVKESGAIITNPLGYIDFMSLVYDCKYVITDSGGIQEETTALNVPCFTFRSDTERPWTLIEHGGSNTLIDAIEPQTPTPDRDRLWNIEHNASDNVMTAVETYMSKLNGRSLL